MQIDQLVLTSVDPAAAGRYYAEVLDLPVQETSEGVEVLAGSTSLVLAPGPVGPGSHHLAFTVPESAFEAAAATVRQRVGLLRVDGREVFEGPAPWNSSSVYFTGPDGVVLELIWRRDLPPLAATGGRAGERITSISEIGIAVTDVFSLVDDLGTTWRLPPFGDPSDAFAPVGDQHGLFICVATARRWAPQGVQAAGGGPLRVRVSTPAGTATLTSSGARSTSRTRWRKGRRPSAGSVASSFHSGMSGCHRDCVRPRCRSLGRQLARCMRLGRC